MSGRTFAILAKPVGGRCNLRCEYCYYLEKPALLGTPDMMPDEVLRALIAQTIKMHGEQAAIDFNWHGGEPLLAGKDFFRRALAYQREYGKGRLIRNTLQTNATLLDDEWCELFARCGFLIGVSIDGPQELHDIYRGKSLERAMRGIELLKKHGVPFNTLTALNAKNAEHPREVYDFLCGITDYMQFLPVVESSAAQYEAERGQRLCEPPGINSPDISHPPAPFAISPQQFGSFMCSVYDIWRNRDRGKKHVQMFEVIAQKLSGRPPSLCTMDALCGHSAGVEANGDAYSCDRFAYPEYRLGNILETPLGELMENNRRFGMHKTYGLAQECLDCEFIKFCFGGCPKDRHVGKNVLCEGYKAFFRIAATAGL